MLCVCFDDGERKVAVERDGSSGYLLSFFVGAYDGEFAVVACPKSD